MSRIGKKPIKIADKVTVKVDDNNYVTVKGPKGEMSQKLSYEVKIELDKGHVVVSQKEKTKTSGAIWGLSRTLVQNMVVGVSDGFQKILEFNGVGYKAQVAGTKLVLSLGYSHPIEFELPEGVQAKVVTNKIHLSSADKEVLGLVAAKIRGFRPPEPYKGKGVKYLEETILRKAGKTGSKK